MNAKQIMEIVVIHVLIFSDYIINVNVKMVIPFQLMLIYVMVIIIITITINNNYEGKLIIML